MQKALDLYTQYILSKETRDGVSHNPRPLVENNDKLTYILNLL